MAVGLIALEDLGPVFFLASLALTGYFAYRMNRIIRKPQPLEEPPRSVYANSLTARALSELSSEEPDFAPVVKLMVKHVERLGLSDRASGRTFLSECKAIDLSRRVDRAVFGRLYYSYLDVVEKIRL
jgi:hypothetical protein